MGATVVTGRNAGAFRTPSGHILYVLFERTYEKNCTPHTPRWSAVGFGSIRDAMRRVFELSAACEGGMLQGREGRILPEDNLRAWLRELANPYLMPDQGHELFLGKGFSDTVQQESFAETRAALERIGREDIAERLEAGEHIPAWLYKDAGLLRALYGSDGGAMPPWLFLSCWPAWGTKDRDPKLGFKPSSGAAPPTEFRLPKVHAIGDDEERFIEQPDGSFKSVGWAYSMVGAFIRSLWEEGLRDPEMCYERIESYRWTVEHAPSIPLEEVRAAVDFSAPMRQRDRVLIDEFAKKFPVMGTKDGFEVTPTVESFHSLLRLPEKSIRWLIPTGTKTQPTTSPVDEPLALSLIPPVAMPTVQLCLF